MGQTGFVAFLTGGRRGILEVGSGFRRFEAGGYAEPIRYRPGDELSVTALPDVEMIPVDEILGE